MIKKTYVGMVDYKGIDWARIAGADVSKMTGVKGVKWLVLENVTGLNGVVDFREVKTVECINSDVSGIKAILCKMDFDIKIKDEQNNSKLSSLMVYEPVNPVQMNAKLIRDYMYPYTK